MGTALPINNRSAATLPKAVQSDAVYDVLKGILILVIIAGHNEAIAYRWPHLRQLFYYFNVQCFLMLSVVLDRKPFTVALLRDRCVRYLVPYGVFMALAAAAYLPLSGFPDGLWNWCRSFSIALYNGQESSIHDAVGMRVFWFLPSLFSLVVLRAMWDRFGGLRVPLIIGALCWMCGVARIPSETLIWLPVGSPSALFFFKPCLATRWLYDRRSPPREAALAVLATGVAGVCCWAILSAPLGWVAGANPAAYDAFEPATFVVGIVFPIAMFFVLLATSRLFRASRFLQACGRYSLGLFLLHMFIYRGLTLAVFGRQFTHLEVVGPQLALGLVLFASTVVISLTVSAAIQCWPRLNALVFPRDWVSWRAAIAGGAA